MTASFVMCRFKFNTAHIFDSAAAYFGSDNVGLCGIAWYFKVRVITHSTGSDCHHTAAYV